MDMAFAATGIETVDNNPWVDQWFVLSSDGKRKYKVSQRKNGEFGCSCPRWTTAKAPKSDCKHITKVKYLVLENGGPSTRNVIASKSKKEAEPKFIRRFREE